MNLIDALKGVVTGLHQREKYKTRGMKRVFQWRRYLEWKNLSPEEKTSAKRFLLIPIFAYIFLTFFNQNFLTIILLISGYLLYKKFEKGKLMK